MSVPNPNENLSIDSFAVSVQGNELHIGYTYENTQGSNNILYERSLTLTGEVMLEFYSALSAQLNANAQAQIDAGEAIDLDAFTVLKAELRAAVIDELSLTIE